MTRADRFPVNALIGLYAGIECGVCRIRRVALRLLGVCGVAEIAWRVTPLRG